MSLSKVQYEARRWLQTAIEDLEAAKLLHQAGKFSHACFLAQQCGKKALKSLWFMLEADPWGHSIQRLVNEFPRKEWIDDMETWASYGAYLDKFYIPARYPNGLPDLTPGQSFTMSEAESAIQKAVFFVERIELIVGM